jgi:hypothetical protein
MWLPGEPFLLNYCAEHQSRFGEQVHEEVLVRNSQTAYAKPNVGGESAN